jgi:predicted MFS family arabinose efflux permease
MSPDSSAPPSARSALGPLRHPFFRALWLATLFSNIGTWVQSVGAAWLMTSLAPSADMVALVQAATALPALAFSLAAGAVADIWDRRAILLLTQGWMLLVAALLSVVTHLGLMTPTLLLVLTFALGAGNAFNGPAWQASVGELVPRDELASAVAINSVGFNMARSIGPAIGGLIVAAAGAEAAFLFNAISYLAVVVAVLLWKRDLPASALPRERLVGAIAAGLRYARQTPALRYALLRALVFGFAASAVWALLPLIAKHDIGGGPLTYGLLLGALGIGAVLGAVVIAPVRRAVGTGTMINLASVVFAATSLVLAYTTWLPAVFAVLVAGGAAWLATLSTFNVAVQTTVSAWVKARALSMYLMSVFGGMAFGSWIWGHVAEAFDVPAALAAAGALMLASMVLHLLSPRGEEGVDTSPASAFAEPQLALEIDPESGPVLVRVEYRIDAKDGAAFGHAMNAVRRVRRRDGATRWSLYQDLAAPERWVELFLVDTWLEHLRQHARGTVADAAILDRARAFHRGDAPPVITHLIRREPRATVPDQAQSGMPF